MSPCNIVGRCTTVNNSFSREIYTLMSGKISISFLKEKQREVLPVAQAQCDWDPDYYIQCLKTWYLVVLKTVHEYFSGKTALTLKALAGTSWLSGETLLNRHSSTADTNDITDNSKSPNCPYLTGDTPLLHTTDSFCAPNCVQTIVNDSNSVSRFSTIDSGVNHLTLNYHGY